jgi:hypothetical protein
MRAEPSRIDSNLITQFTELKDCFRIANGDIFDDIENKKKFQIGVVKDGETSQIKFQVINTTNTGKFFWFDDFIKLIFSLDNPKLAPEQKNVVSNALSVAL